MNLPPYGLCLPAKCVRVIDGDTVVVSLLGVMDWHIRLIGCWAPEKNHPLGVKAAEFAEAMIGDSDAISVWIPAPEHLKKNLLGHLTMERVPGHLFIGTEETLAEKIIRAGLAWSTKAELEAALKLYDETLVKHGAA